MPGDDRGSALMLMPALILVLLALATLSLDAAVSFMGRRELAAATSAAASDAAVGALRHDALYGECAALRPDEAAARELADRAFAARGSGAYELVALEVSVGTATAGAAGVEVRAEAEVDLIVAPAVGGDRSRTVRAASTAVVSPDELGASAC